MSAEFNEIAVFRIVSCALLSIAELQDTTACVFIDMSVRFSTSSVFTSIPSNLVDFARLLRQKPWGRLVTQATSQQVRKYIRTQQAPHGGAIQGLLEMASQLGDMASSGAGMVPIEGAMSTLKAIAGGYGFQLPNAGV